MGKNVGTTDRIARLVVAVAAAAIGVVLGPGAVAYILYAVAVIMAVTAVVGFCPIYRLIGVNTCPVPKRANRV